MRTSELREAERARSALQEASPRRRVVRFADAEPWRGSARDQVEALFREECRQRMFGGGEERILG